jgi:hypothetical protein
VGTGAVVRAGHDFGLSWICRLLRVSLAGLSALNNVSFRAEFFHPLADEKTQSRNLLLLVIPSGFSRKESVVDVNVRN